MKENIENYKVGLLYFLWIASSAAWFPMFNLYFEKIGFNGLQVGIIASIIPVTMLVGQPFVSVLADKFGRLRMLTLILLITAVFILGLIIKGNFTYFFIATVLFSLVYAPINPLVDSTVLDFVESSPKSSYSKMRMWGAIGWMTCTYVTGLLVSSTELYYIFIIGSGLLVATALISLTIKNKHEKTASQSITFNDAGKVILDPKVLVFLFVLFIYGIGSIPINTFYSIYLNKIGASPKIIGLSFSIQALSELPFLFVASKLVKKYGALRLIAVAMIAAGLRILFYTQIENPYTALVLDTSNGICYSLFLVGAVEYLNEIVPAKFRATGQSLFWAAYYGAGLIVGNLLTGFVYNQTSIQTAFAVDGMLLLLMALLPIYMFSQQRKTALNQ